MSATELRNGIVLVVEDNADDVEFFRIAMRKANLEGSCHFVFDGEEAIAYMKGAPPFTDRIAYPFPSIVVLDLSLPKINGFGVLEWMAATPGCEQIKVLIWSAWTYEEEMRRAKKAGVSSFVMKDESGQGMAELIALISAHTNPPAGTPVVEG